MYMEMQRIKITQGTTEWGGEASSGGCGDNERI